MPSRRGSGGRFSYATATKNAGRTIDHRLVFEQLTTERSAGTRIELIRRKENSHLFNECSNNFNIFHCNVNSMPFRTPTRSLSAIHFLISKFMVIWNIIHPLARKRWTNSMKMYRVKRIKRLPAQHSTVVPAPLALALTDFDASISIITEKYCLKKKRT